MSGEAELKLHGVAELPLCPVAALRLSNLQKSCKAAAQAASGVCALGALQPASVVAVAVVAAAARTGAAAA